MLGIHCEPDAFQHIDEGREPVRPSEGQLVVIAPSSHLTLSHAPVKVNSAVRVFVDGRGARP